MLTDGLKMVTDYYKSVLAELRCDIKYSKRVSASEILMFDSIYCDALRARCVIDMNEIEKMADELHEERNGRTDQGNGQTD